jgi:hypothetical protein
MEASIMGQRDVIRQMLVSLLANGHLLLESLPGLAKTRAVKSLAKNLDAAMRRIQFTPDLLPSDITGTEVLHQEDGKNVFQFQPGPIFGNIILADEINRAPAKVQAALLEAMEERQITVAGTTHTMPELVHGARHSESDRARGNLSPARSAIGPVFDEGPHHLSRCGQRARRAAIGPKRRNRRDCLCTGCARVTAGKDRRQAAARHRVSSSRRSIPTKRGKLEARSSKHEIWVQISIFGFRD